MLLTLSLQSAHAEKVLRLTLQLPATHHLGINVQSFAEEVARVEKELRDEMAQLEADAFDFVADKMKIIELTPEEMAG